MRFIARSVILILELGVHMKASKIEPQRISIIPQKSIFNIYKKRTKSVLKELFISSDRKNPD